MLDATMSGGDGGRGDPGADRTTTTGVFLKQRCRFGSERGSARRRRERRLCSILRRERQTVAMELAAALHHSCDARPDVSHEVLREQKTASSGRPGVLKEPEPQLVDAVLSYRAAWPCRLSRVWVARRSTGFEGGEAEDAGGQPQGPPWSAVHRPPSGPLLLILCWDEEEEEEEAASSSYILSSWHAAGALVFTAGLRHARQALAVCKFSRPSRQLWRRLPSSGACLPTIGTTTLVVSRPTGTQKSCALQVSGCRWMSCLLHLCNSTFLAFQVVSIGVSPR